MLFDIGMVTYDQKRKQHFLLFFRLKVEEEEKRFQERLYPARDL